MISHADFAAARNKALAEAGGQGGIGTLGEKLTHRILKLCLDPCEENHEISYLGCVADIKNSEGIIEIQTSSFDYLVPKLKKFLPKTAVTVVYPIVRNKTVLWYNKDTGEISEPRKTTRPGRPTDILPEVSKLTDLIPHDNLTVRIIFLCAEEYKCLDGWDKTKKRGSTKIDCIPTAIEDMVDLRSAADYAALLPDSLPSPFTAKDFNKACALKGRRAYFSLKFLTSLGIAEKIGKKGNAFLYERLI